MRPRLRVIAADRFWALITFILEELADESVKSAVPAEIDFSLSLVLQVWDERMDILYAVNGIDNTHSLRYWARSAALRPVVNLARIGH